MAEAAIQSLLDQLRPAAFVQNLFELVSDPGTDSAARWTEDGKAFVLIDDTAMRKYLPRWFNHNRFESLLRQLSFVRHFAWVFGFCGLCHLRVVLRGKNGTPWLTQGG